MCLQSNDCAGKQRSHYVPNNSSHTASEFKDSFVCWQRDFSFSTGSLLQASQEMPWDLLSVPQLGRRYFVWCEGCSVLGCPSSLGWLKPRSAELTHGLLTGALQLFPTAAVSLLGPAGLYCPIRQVALTAGGKGKFQALSLLSPPLWNGITPVSVP